MSNILQANRLLHYYYFFEKRAKFFNPYLSAITEHKKTLLPETCAIYTRLTDAFEVAKQQFTQDRNEVNATNFVQAIEALTVFMELLKFPFVSLEQYIQLNPELLPLIAQTTPEGIEYVDKDTRPLQKRPCSP